MVKHIRFSLEKDKEKLRSILKEVVILSKINAESIPYVEYFIEDKKIYTVYPYYEVKLYLNFYKILFFMF